LNSTFVKSQVDRAAIGGTRDALDYPSVRGLQIPVLRDQVGEIASTVRDVISARRSGSGLTTAAKLLVEALIEGQLTESDLIAAQQALEAGDEGPDRAILARLATDGLDGSGTPLFPDLDRLATLLERADAEAAGDA
jgi:type I restriction enzyme S subunit